MAKYAIHGKLTAYDAYAMDSIQGASVVVRNANNRVIGAGTTSTLVVSSADPTTSDYQFPYVTFKVSVPKVKMYQIKIGTHDGPVYTFKQLVKSHWKINLSLGQP